MDHLYRRSNSQRQYSIYHLVILGAEGSFASFTRPLRLQLWILPSSVFQIYLFSTAHMKPSHQKRWQIQMLAKLRSWQAQLEVRGLFTISIIFYPANDTNSNDSGIGAAIAVSIADTGANVALLDLTANSQLETKLACEKAGVTALVYSCDVVDLETTKRVFGQIKIDLGPIEWSPIFTHALGYY